MTPNTILLTWILHDVDNLVPKFFWDLGFSLMFFKGFMLMTVTSFTELQAFSCLSFNIQTEDLSGKVDKISRIIFKYTVHN